MGQREEAPCGTLSRDWLPGSLRLCQLPAAAPALAQRPSLSCPVTCQSRGYFAGSTKEQHSLGLSYKCECVTDAEEAVHTYCPGGPRGGHSPAHHWVLRCLTPRRRHVGWTAPLPSHLSSKPAMDGFHFILTELRD